MNGRSALLVLLLASCGPAAAPDAKAPPTSTGDGWRVIAEVDALQALPAGKQVPEEVTKLLGPLAFEDRQCPPSGGSVGALLGAGEGAFSGKGAKEGIYLVDVWPCHAPADAHGGATQLVVLDGAKKILGEVVPEKSVYVIPDLDGDGDNEILLVGVSHAGGVSTRTARLCSLDGGKLETIYDLGVIAQTQCPAGQDEAATVSFRVRGTAMEFHHEKHARPCR